MVFIKKAIIFFICPSRNSLILMIIKFSCYVIMIYIYMSISINIHISCIIYWLHAKLTKYKQPLHAIDTWETGVSKVPFYLFSSHSQDQVASKMMRNMISVSQEEITCFIASPVLRDCTSAELSLAQPSGKFKFGKYLHTVQIDTKPYLEYLLNYFLSGGRLVRNRVS